RVQRRDGEPATFEVGRGGGQAGQRGVVGRVRAQGGNVAGIAVGEDDQAAPADDEVPVRRRQFGRQRRVVPVQAAPGVVDDARARVGQFAVDAAEEVAVALPGADLVALAGAVVVGTRVIDDARGHDARVRRDAAAPVAD